MGQGSPAAGQPLRVAISPHLQKVSGAGELRLVGLRVNAAARRIRGVVVSCRAEGLDARPELLVSGSAELTDDVPAMYKRLHGATSPVAESATLARYVADAAGDLVQAMLAEAGIAAESVLAIGAVEPGLWHFEPGAPNSYASICDAARLAERTGINCIDAFPMRDLACGGLGGPLMALPYWMLFRDAAQTRVALDLGRTTRVTYLPATSVRGAQGRILSFDVGAGTILTDRLVKQLTHGQLTHDPGGSLAVQGRRIPDLIDHWLSDPYFQSSPPRWYPLGVKPEKELSETVRMAVEAGWSVRDLLCTATHFIAETVAQAMNDRLPRLPHIEQVILTGGGQANGMLLREIAARVPGDSGAPEPEWRRGSQFGWSDEVLEPVGAALLALLHLEQIPANHPAITGTSTPRVLGRLTPGSPQNWRRLVQHLAGSLPQTMSLRAAV